MDNANNDSQATPVKATGAKARDDGTNLKKSCEHAPGTNGIIKDIYSKYNKGLYRFLRRKLDSKEDMDDVAQEVYLRLVRHRNPEDIRPSLALLCTIASNLLKDRYRRMKVRSMHSHMSISDADIESSDASPEDIVKSKEGLKYFQTVYRTLNKECRQAFMLHRFKGCTYDEIAAEMGISKSMVQKHISYVLFQLGKKFESFI